MKSGAGVKKVPENVTPDVALTIIRGLAGAKDYPFHVEGEKRRAAVLVECCDGVAHARQVIEDFDSAEDCPTVDALRGAARRLGEICACGKPKWAHRDGGGCRMFNQAPAEDEGWTKTAGGFAKFRQSVPMIAGVPLEVALQVETIRIHMGKRGTPPNIQDWRVCQERFPEAVAAIERGVEPDYKLVEAQMRALFPKVFKRSKSEQGQLRTVSDRIADMDKPYAVESITPESV